MTVFLPSQYSQTLHQGRDILPGSYDSDCPGYEVQQCVDM